MKKLLTAFILLAFVKVSAQDCANADDCLQKGINAYYQGPAIELLDKAIKLAKKEGKNLSNFYLQRGIKYYNHYEPSVKEAEKDFNNAIEADDKNFWPHMWLANVYAYKQQDVAKASEYLTGILGKFNNDPRIFYERAQMYRWYNQTDMAITDMEMAYNMLLEDASQVDEGRRADIVMWHAMLNLQKKQTHIADEESVKILESGVNIAPNSAKLIGALALGYYDLGDMIKAGEYGSKANAIGSNNVGGQLFDAMKFLSEKNYQAAYNTAVRALEADISDHPMVHYMYAISHWEYLVAKFPGAWNSYKAGIRKSMEKCYWNGKGTKYNEYATWANNNLSKVQ